MAFFANAVDSPLSLRSALHEDVVLRLFPYSLGEIGFNWYVNLPLGCIGDWDIFKKSFLEQFKTFINPAVIHQQFISIKRDLVETVSRFNHRFHMAYCKLETLYTILVEVPIVILTKIVVVRASIVSLEVVIFSL